MSQAEIITAISQDWDILKLKLEHFSRNSDFVDDAQELNYHLQDLRAYLNVVNRGLPALPNEREVSAVDESEI